MWDEVIGGESHCNRCGYSHGTMGDKCKCKHCGKEDHEFSDCDCAGALVELFDDVIKKESEELKPIIEKVQKKQDAIRKLKEIAVSQQKREDNEKEKIVFFDSFHEKFEDFFTEYSESLETKHVNKDGKLLFTSNPSMCRGINNSEPLTEEIDMIEMLIKFFKDNGGKLEQKIVTEEDDLVFQPVEDDDIDCLLERVAKRDS